VFSFRHGCDCFSEIAFYGEIKEAFMIHAGKESLSLSIGARGLQRLADACVDFGSDAEKLGMVTRGGVRTVLRDIG
jgi:hypothetical protein